MPVARVLSIAVAAALLLAAPAAGHDRGADLVLHSGFVWTGDARGTIAQAVAIKGERIVAVGSNHKVLRHVGRRTRRVNLRGGFVAPGFRDQHTHLLGMATGGAPASAYRPSWTGYDEQAAVASRRRTGQRHVDIKAQGKTPQDDCAHSPVTDKLESDILAMQDEVAKQGLSAVVEAGLRDLGTLDALFALSREDKLEVRFLVRVGFGCMEEAARMGLRTGSGDEWVKVLGVKLYADGWLGPRTSALREPYSDDPYGFPREGILFLEQARANTPSRDYLFNADNNIELGTALLNVLLYKQFEDVDNTVSREYCIISAYNTGLRNVLRTFSKDMVAAVNQINSLEPPAVYEKLRQSLPYQETRDYLVKVTSFRKQFVSAQ